MFRFRNGRYMEEVTEMFSDYLLNDVPGFLLQKPSILHLIKSPGIYLLSQIHSRLWDGLCFSTE